MLVVFSLAYLAAFALYQGDAKRCALHSPPAIAITALKTCGHALLLVVLTASVVAWGGERGIPSALVALCLAAPLSLLLGSRWPRLHVYSAPVAALLAVAGAAV